MTRTVIELLTRRLNAAYRDDPFHALRRNIDALRADEWDLRPEEWSVEEFGAQAEISFCDLVAHVAGAKHMWADRIFGQASLDWGDLTPPSVEMATLLAWLDEGHQQLVTGLQALTDDAELLEQRPAPWRTPMVREHMLGIITNHDLYHAGEINRQRSMLRGTSGWPKPG